MCIRDRLRNPANKSVTNNMFKWNRMKSFRMDNAQQEAYEARLKKGRTYNYNWSDESGDYSSEIPKLIYDALDIPAIDKTA